MAQVALPRATTFTVAVPRLLGSVRVLMPLLLVAGCASCHTGWPIPPEVTQSGVAARVLIPPDLNVNPPETVVKPGTPGPARQLPDAGGEGRQVHCVGRHPRLMPRPPLGGLP